MPALYGALHACTVWCSACMHCMVLCMHALFLSKVRSWDLSPETVEAILVLETGSHHVLWAGLKLTVQSRLVSL